MFIGREREIAELNDLYQQNRFQLFVLYGRRRVGKTTLLKEFCRDKPSVFYSAEQTSNKMNLQKFSALVSEYYAQTSLEPFPTWENALLYLHEKQMGKPLVLVFDEFPYIANRNPSLLSALQHLIDHTLQYGSLFLVLCGSYMGFMEREVLGSKSPLFGRRTAQLHMKAFDYQTSIKFLEGFSDQEKLMLYGAFGGTALYLNQIRPEKSVKENIRDLCLNPMGYLYEEPLFLLRQEVQEPGAYSAVIEAIANGASKANEIAIRTGEETVKCLKYIKTLCELGILEKETPFGEKDSSKKTLYYISDFMFRFWYRYVAGNKTLLEMDAQEIVWERKILPDYNHYMGLVFERVCRDYLLHQNSRGKLPVLFTKIGRWWGTSAEGRQVEIDLVAKEDKDYLICECKWTNEETGIAVLHDLWKKADAMTKNRGRTWFVLFSKSGFTDTVVQEAAVRSDILLISLEEILSI